MAGLASLAATLDNLAKRAGLAAAEVDRVTENVGRLPPTTDVPTPVTRAPPRETGTVVSDDLPPQIVPPARRFFGASGRSGSSADDVGDAIDDARDSAEELQDELAEMDAFFRSSSAGKMLEKLFGGFGFGGAGGTAIDALTLVENYLETRERLRDRKTTPLQIESLQYALARQQDFFRRLFGTSLGSIQDVARELLKFRERFPGYEADGASAGGSASRNTPSSGTLGKGKTTACEPSSSLDMLLKSGALR